MAARALRIVLVAGGLLAMTGPAEAVSFAFTPIAGDTLSDAQAQAFAAAAGGGARAGVASRLSGPARR